MAEQTQEQTQELSEQIEESLSNRRDDSQVYIASQWQLMWWRLRRHKLAMASLIVLAGFYFISAFAEFFAYTILCGLMLILRRYLFSRFNGLMGGNLIHMFIQYLSLIHI